MSGSGFGIAKILLVPKHYGIITMEAKAKC